MIQCFYVDTHDKMTLNLNHIIYICAHLNTHIFDSITIWTPTLAGMSLDSFTATPDRITSQEQTKNCKQEPNQKQPTSKQKATKK